MVSSSKQGARAGFGCRAFSGSPRFAKLAYWRATRALSLRCQSRSAWAVRPASPAASARHSVWHQSVGKVGALCTLCYASKTRAFGRAGSAVHAPVSEHFMRLPVSQRLRPQCVVMQTHSNAKFLASAVRVSASKAKRCAAPQPPNPSFKRTCLRQSA